MAEPMTVRHRPAGHARPATIDDVVKSGEKDLVIPGLVGADGEPLTLRVRKVHAGERETLLPPLPAHLFERLPDELEQRVAVLAERRQHWLASLSPEEIDRRTEAAGRFFARLVALASVDPLLTEAQAARLGDAAPALANEIIAFSQNSPPGAAPASTAAPRALSREDFRL